MRTLLLVHVLSLALTAQTPVDYPALRSAVASALAAFNADLEAQAKAGIPRDKQTRDFDKPAQAIRAQGAGAQGELRDACLLAELAFVSKLKYPDALLGQVLAEVPAESRAWSLLDPKLASVLICSMGEKGEAYALRMGAKGLPELRPVVLARLVQDQLDEDRFEEAKVLVAGLVKDFPADPATAEAAEQLKDALITTVGLQAPEFTLASLDELLFAMIVLGDDRLVERTVISQAA